MRIYDTLTSDTRMSDLRIFIIIYQAVIEFYLNVYYLHMFKSLLPVSCYALVIFLQKVYPFLRQINVCPFICLFYAASFRLAVPQIMAANVCVLTMFISSYASHLNTLNADECQHHIIIWMVDKEAANSYNIIWLPFYNRNMSPVYHTVIISLS